MTSNTQLKKIFSVTVIAALLSACQPAKVETPKAAGGDKPADAGAGGLLQAVGAGEGALSIIAWPGYIERGETDKGYDWVTKFEGDTGCKVTVKTAGTSDEMVSLMKDARCHCQWLNCILDSV